MTGELFALLRQHSVLARLMPADGSSPESTDAFLRGVDAARDPRGLTHALFSVRTLGLFKQLAAEQLPDYLSGLLIGHEITRELNGETTRLTLVGDPALCARYAQALRHLGHAAPLQLDNTAPAGLWRLAQTLDLL
jgi:2-dehydro-3-deoxygalactonokinase